MSMTSLLLILFDYQKGMRGFIDFKLIHFHIERIFLKIPNKRPLNMWLLRIGAPLETQMGGLIRWRHLFNLLSPKRGRFFEGALV